MDAKLKDYLQFQSFFFDVEQEFSSALRPAALGIISEPALIPVTFPFLFDSYFFFCSILIPISLGTIFHSEKKRLQKKKKKSMCRS